MNPFLSLSVGFFSIILIQSTGWALGPHSGRGAVGSGGTGSSAPAKSGRPSWNEYRNDGKSGPLGFDKMLSDNLQACFDSTKSILFSKVFPKTGPAGLTGKFESCLAAFEREVSRKPDEPVRSYEAARAEQAEREETFFSCLGAACAVAKRIPSPALPEITAFCTAASTVRAAGDCYKAMMTLAASPLKPALESGAAGPLACKSKNYCRSCVKCCEQYSAKYGLESEITSCFAMCAAKSGGIGEGYFGIGTPCS